MRKLTDAEQQGTVVMLTVLGSILLFFVGLVMYLFISSQG